MGIMMDGLIGLIFWGIIISKIVKAFKGEDKKKNKNQRKQPRQEYRYQTAQQRPVQRTVNTQRDASYYYNNVQSTKARLQQKYGMQQRPNNGSDILSRAKENVKENEADAVQQEIHAQVCREYREHADTASDVAVHKVLSVQCDTGEESDFMKKVNDLMITGYSGDLEFDRDFIAEGVDMLNRFSI